MWRPGQGFIDSTQAAILSDALDRNAWEASRSPTTRDVDTFVATGMGWFVGPFVTTRLPGSKPLEASGEEYVPAPVLRTEVIDEPETSARDAPVVGSHEWRLRMQEFQALQERYGDPEVAARVQMNVPKYGTQAGAVVTGNVQVLEQMRRSAAGLPVRGQPAGVPGWVWGLGAVALGGVAAALFRRRRRR